MFCIVMKPFIFFRKLLPRLRSRPRVVRNQAVPPQDETTVVPVWVGSQLTVYPLVVRKRTRSVAQFYDEWE